MPSLFLSSNTTPAMVFVLGSSPKLLSVLLAPEVSTMLLMTSLPAVPPVLPAVSLPSL